MADQKKTPKVQTGNPRGGTFTRTTTFTRESFMRDLKKVAAKRQAQ